MYATLVDRSYLEERLAALGGPGAAIVKHEASSTSAGYRLRHSIEARHLPPPVRTIVRGDLTIDRAETWQVSDDGYSGSVQVTIPGVPGELSGTIRLDAVPTGSELVIDGSVSIPIPLFGGRIEESVVEHLRMLLDAEGEFTATWVAER